MPSKCTCRRGGYSVPEGVAAFSAAATAAAFSARLYDLGMDVYLATCAAGDISNEPQSEDIGIYSTPEKATEAVERNASYTGTVERFTLDAEDPYGEVLRWRENGQWRVASPPSQ